MPKTPRDFSKGLIYSIVCKTDETLIYIGSTTNYTKRKNQHKKICRNENNKGHNLQVYVMIRANGGWDNFEMKPVKEFPCDNVIQLTIEEERLRKELQANLNTRRAFVSEEEAKELRQKYRDENKAEIQKYYQDHKTEAKKYRQEHKTEMNEYAKQYREDPIHAATNKEYLRKYRETHAAELKEKDRLRNDEKNKKAREKRLANKEERNKKLREKRLANKDEINKKRRERRLAKKLSGTIV